MKLLFLSVAICALITGQASAQDNPSGPPRERAGPTDSRNVLEQPIIPAPEGRNSIVLKFRDQAPTQVYFKRPIKSVRISDELMITAVPKSDHIIAFSGLSPGDTNVIVESKDGSRETVAFVTVVSPVHDVKIYQSGQINQVTGERRSDSSSAIGGYVVLSCNEVGCTEKEPELQARLPKSQ